MSAFESANRTYFVVAQSAPDREETLARSAMSSSGQFSEVAALQRDVFTRESGHWTDIPEVRLVPEVGRPSPSAASIRQAQLTKICCHPVQDRGGKYHCFLESCHRQIRIKAHHLRKGLPGLVDPAGT
jgi:hypothetical protein